MSDLAEQIRTYVDSSAAPIALEEITGGPDHAAPPSSPPTPGRHRGRWLAVAAVVVAVALVSALVVTHRSAGPARVVAGPSTSTTAAARGWLTVFGAEAAAAPVPAGWKVLDAGDIRFAVPPGWDTTNSPCPGTEPVAPGRVVVITSKDRAIYGCPAISQLPASQLTLRPNDDTTAGVATHVGTLPATRLDEKDCCTQRYRLADGYELTIGGPDTVRVLSTFTDSGAHRALQAGPVADTRGWRTVRYQGVELRVPPSWPVDDLPGSYHQIVDENGVVTGSGGLLNPGECGGGLFPVGAPRVSLGTSPGAAACPYLPSPELEGGDGVWIRPITEDSASSLAAPLVHGALGGLDLAVYPTPDDVAPPVVTLVVTRGAQRYEVSIGVGRDPAVARAILRSLRAA
jgi:hypothetical protein